MAHVMARLRKRKVLSGLDLQCPSTTTGPQMSWQTLDIVIAVVGFLVGVAVPFLFPVSRKIVLETVSHPNKRSHIVRDENGEIHVEQTTPTREAAT